MALPWETNTATGSPSNRLSTEADSNPGIRTKVAGVAVNSTGPATVDKEMSVSPATARGWSPLIRDMVPNKP